MKILLAIDESPPSEAATEEVRQRPWPTPSTVRILSVIQPYVPPATEIVLAGATLQEIRERQATEADRLVKQAGERISAPGRLSVETAIAETDPRTAIVDAADEWQADLIVVGVSWADGSEAVDARQRRTVCRGACPLFRRGRSAPHGS